ncbi:hypothetical protein [Streptosporangium sp. NPDC051022]|uniref:hypothetical protein n=1 Tax=Streptosporangium sp. NPDC051022 TaxID=3155752 RepID=UPI0034235C88
MRFTGARAVFGALTVAAATVATVATVIAGPAGTGTASAAGPCWYDKPSTNYWWCNNTSGAKVYGGSEISNYPDPGHVVGWMYSNPSWFVCRRDDGPYVGGPHPNRWLFTKADNGAYGWMKDTSISSETNPVDPC